MTETLPSYATFTSSDLESRDSIVVLILNFDSILKKKCMSHHGICTTIKKQKYVSIFHKDVSHWACQKYVYVGFWV